jgi:hypothetical protein
MDMHININELKRARLLEHPCLLPVRPERGWWNMNQDGLCLSAMQRRYYLSGCARTNESLGGSV